MSSSAPSTYSLKSPFATDSAPSSVSSPAPARPAAASSAASAARRPNFQFDLRDIEGCSSVSYVSRLHHDARCPLDPVYKLASVQERPVTPPRFLRDAIAVGDIARAQPSKLHTAPARKVTSLDASDIQGARPLARYPSQPHPRVPSSLRSATEGINGGDTEYLFRSQRHTDPNDPVYSYGRSSSLSVSAALGRLGGRGRAVGGGGEESKEQSAGDTLVSFGPVPGSKPRALPPARSRSTGESDLSLRTADISSAAARDWSWTKPARTEWTTLPFDPRSVPGAQSLADQAWMLRQSSRHTDPNARDYSANFLGGQRVSEQDGMVHVHRHVLDGTLAAAAWKPVAGEPAPDAAGVSMSRTGNFTAGMLRPKPAASKPAPAAAAPALAAVAHQRQESKSSRVAFGAPAADEPIRDTPAEVERVATPAALAAPAPSLASFLASNDASTSASASAVVDAKEEMQAAPAAAATQAKDPRMSYPIDARRPPAQQKRHVAAVGATGASTGANFFAQPQSRGREVMPAEANARVPLFQFGVRAPFAVSTEKASIEETQQASTSQSASRSVSRASRSNSRPGSSPTSRPLSGSRHDAASMAPFSSTQSNQFAMSFGPSSTMRLPSSLPYSSAVSRPGLSSIEYFERSRQGQTDVQRVQERKMATLRASEINAVQALG